MTDEEEKQKSLEFLKNPERWPGISFDGGTKCHVKRRKASGGMPETGVVNSSLPLTIYVFPEENPMGRPTATPFESVEEMIEAGWVVD